MRREYLLRKYAEEEEPDVLNRQKERAQPILYTEEKNGLKLPRDSAIIMVRYVCGRCAKTGDVVTRHKKNLARPYGSSENSRGVSSAMSATVFPVIPAKVKPTCWWPKAYTTFVFAALLPMTGR